MPVWVILFGSFVILLVIRVPLGFAIGIATLLTMAIEGMPLTTLAVTYFSAVDTFAFMAIPLFLFAGSLMEHGGISARLIAVADVLLGRLVGGLSLVTIGASMFFGALTGAGNTATAAVGSMMIPTMIKRGYPEAAARIQELFLAGRKEEAADAGAQEAGGSGGSRAALRCDMYVG